MDASRGLCSDQHRSEAFSGSSTLPVPRTAQRADHESPDIRKADPSRSRHLPAVLSVDEMESLLAQPDRRTPVGVRDLAAPRGPVCERRACGRAAGDELSDIDWDGGTIRVLGKGQKDRIVLLGERAMLCLEMYIHEARPLLMNGHDEPHLFLSRLGRRSAFACFTSR